MIHTNGLHLTLERKADLATARPEPRPQPRTGALEAAAITLSRRNADAATCEPLNEALGRLTDLCFEGDAGDALALCNVDYATGRILIPLPWGRNGRAHWGLRPQEANILRQWLWDAAHSGYPPLYWYERNRRAWFVGLGDYTDRQEAGLWLRTHQVTVRDYRAARDKVLGNA